jgi:hypothetical protein
MNLKYNKKKAFPSCFITLTYNDDYVPYRPIIDSNSNEITGKIQTLRPRDFVLFMKRLRKKLEPQKVRFFHCGEYGEKFERPHHHACLFGWKPPDLKLFKTINNVPLFRSAILEEIWPFGYVTVGAVTFESAAYVARYIMKKQNGDKADEHYKGRLPEYITMSRRPGLAHDWLDKYLSDVYPQDSVIIRDNLICKPPKYYDNIYDSTNHDSYVKIKERRKTLASENPNNTPERLKIREEVKKDKLTRLIRTLE